MNAIRLLVLITALPTLCFSFIKSDCKPCPPSWLQFDCKCYRAFQVPKTWMEAEDTCALFGAHLMSIYDDSEAEFFMALANSTILGTTVWTGGFKREREKHYQWTDGSRWIFPLEVPEHPGDVDICVALSYYRSPWKSLLCSAQRPFICQKAIDYDEI